MKASTSIVMAIVIAYALVVLVGGWMGYYQSASLASLVSGCVFGLLLLGCAYGMSKYQAAAAYCALILSLILDAFFTLRFVKTLTFFPSGLMSLCSLCVVIALVVLLKKFQKLAKGRD